MVKRMNNQMLTVILSAIIVITLFSGITAFLAFHAVVLGALLILTFAAFLLITFYVRVRNVRKQTRGKTETDRHVLERDKANEEYFDEVNRREFFGIEPESPESSIEEQSAIEKELKKKKLEKEEKKKIES
jgi:ABC-type transport system involved in cytochrome bd biosynthesis fused ATPase/permease subunit